MSKMPANIAHEMADLLDEMAGQAFAHGDEPDARHLSEVADEIRHIFGRQSLTKGENA